ncbi:MAG: hypothetical protein Q9223_002927 [Gallowayella weberi]
MAEALIGLGVAANVLHFITAGYQLLDRITEFQSKTKDVPSFFKEILTQLPLIIETCKKLSEDDHPLDTTTFLEVVRGCLEHVQHLDTLLSKMIPEDQDSRAVRTWKAMGSLRLEKKILQCRNILEIYKTALILHLSRRGSATAQSRDNAPAHALSSLRDTCYRYPSSQVSQFIGQEDLLDKVDKTLLAPSTDSRRPNVAVLLGMGGQGKTALALEYCRRAHSNAHFKSILWIDAAAPATVAQSFENLADYLAKRQRQFKDLEACLEFVKGTIETWAAPWLVVFDNFDQPSKVPNIMRFVPNAYNGAVLVTSRHADSGALGTVIEMGSMREDESINLLLHRTHGPPTFHNVEGARLVVQSLGCLPLAIDQAGAYIRSRKIPFSVFLDHFEKRRGKILQHTPDLWDYRRKLNDQQNEISVSVFTTWELSFQRIADDEEQRTSMGHFMTLLGFFHNLDIQEDMFKAYYCHSSPAPSWMEMFTTNTEWDSYSYQDAVVSLSQLSLLQHTRGGEHSAALISLHPLIRDWTQYRLPPADRRAYTMEAMSVMRAYITPNEAGTKNWTLQTTREVLANIDTCMENYTRFCSFQAHAPCEEIRDCLIEFGLFYTKYGRYQNGEDLLERVLANDIMCFGSEHVKTYETNLHITDVYLRLGRYHDVEELLQAILPRVEELSTTIRGRVFYNLGKASYKQGEYQKALDHYKSALQNQETFLVQGHPELLNTYQAMANVYRGKGRNDDAIALYTKTLDSYRELHGESHLDIFSTMDYLGNCYRNLAKFDKADHLYRTALNGNEKHLGSDHPKTLANKVNIAITDMYRYQYKEAEELFTAVLAIWETRLGLNHPEPLRASMYLASLYLSQGHYEQACTSLSQVLEGRLKRLEVDSNYTLYTIERLLSALWLHGRIGEADVLATRMLQLQRKDPGLGNPYSDEEVAMLKQDFPYTAVEIIFSRSLKLRRVNLAWTHNDIVDVSRSLALVYSAQNRPQEAENMLRRVFEAYQSRCGPRHTLTLKAKQELCDIRARGTIATISETNVQSAVVDPVPALLGEDQAPAPQCSLLGESLEHNKNLDFVCD